MKKIMIIGAGDFQLPLVQKAAESCHVILVAPAIGEEFLPYIDKKYLLDVRKKEEILAIARQEQIDGVITDQTDIAVRSVAYVAEQMGLPGIGYETGCLFTDKRLMREKSRGVQICRNAEELEEKYAEAERWSSDHSVMIERCATGREFVVEGLAWNYEFRNLNCGDTLYFNLPDAFAAKSRIFPSTADASLTKRVCDLNARIITGFGLKQGITHSEFIMEGDDIYLMETAARGGGVFISSDLISLSTGLHTEEYLLNIALGQQEALPEILPQQCYCGYMAFYIPTGKVIRAEGMREVQELPFVHRNQLDELKQGMVNTGGMSDKTTRLAIIVSGATREELNARMQTVRDMLRVEVETEDGIKGLIWE